VNTIWQFLLHSELAHFVMAGIALTAISSLEAPTKDSSPTYRFMFRFLNALALQFKRMFPKIEDSPNFQDAVNIQTEKAGLPPIPVQKPAPAEPSAGDAPIPPKL
jgi:hypothetical protein